MHAKLEHRNHKRVTAVCPLCVLGKVARLVQSVTIPAPIDKIFLCGIFALAFDLLDFLRNQTTNFLLTVCQFFTPFLIPAAPARAPGVATPSGFRQPRRWRGLPRHPAPTGPPRSSGPGVSARSLPAPPAGGTRSLTGSRRCPRSMTPGTAAAPAPGCWPRLLRPAADGGALRKPRRYGCGSRKRPRATERTESGSCAGPNSAYNIV